MSNLSDFLGGSGGGGDPQATFQASANVANGDLVVLNDNGTVAPVTSTLNAEDFSKSNNGTKIVDNGTPSFSQPATWGRYNAAVDRHLFATREDGGNLYHNIQVGTYNSSTGTYSLQYRGQFSGFANFLAYRSSPSNGFLYMYGGTSSQAYVRGFYWDSGTYNLTGEANFHNSNNWVSNCQYINPNGDNSTIFTCAGINGNGYISATYGSWNGTSSTPSVGDQLHNRYWTSGGTSWNQSFFSGAHVDSNIHVFAISDQSSNVWLLAAKVETSATTYKGTQLNVQKSGNLSSIAYDSDANIGVFCYTDNSNTSKRTFKVFTVNKATLDCTVLNTFSSAYTGTLGQVGFNSLAKQFMHVPSGQTNLVKAEYFGLSSTGEVLNKKEQFLHSNGTTQFEFNVVYDIVGTNSQVIVFNSGSNPTSNYIDTVNHTYATQVDLEYVDTNVDKHFGEAKEAITSGNAGPVGILNRTVDVTGSSFQKGQKLFANPSGSALATSGTYRVGYATDGDTVLVTGDAS